MISHPCIFSIFHHLWFFDTEWGAGICPSGALFFIKKCGEEETKAEPAAQIKVVRGNRILIDEGRESDICNVCVIS